MTSPGVADADLGLVFVSNLQHDQYNRIYLREFKDPYREKSLLKSPVFT